MNAAARDVVGTHSHFAKPERVLLTCENIVFCCITVRTLHYVHLLSFGAQYVAWSDGVPPPIVSSLRSGNLRTSLEDVGGGTCVQEEKNVFK